MREEDLAGLNISDEERADMLAMLGAESDPDDGGERKGKRVTEEEIQPEASRRSYYIFPPKNSGLKIPRSLFLYSSPTPSSPTPSTKPSTTKSKLKRTLRGKGMQEVEGEEEIKEQTEEMARLMRRSVATYEFKERVMWDEDADPHSESEERVKVIELDGSADKEVEHVIRDWMGELD